MVNIGISINKVQKPYPLVYLKIETEDKCVEALMRELELIPEEERNFKKWVSRRQNNETSEWQTVCKK